MLSIINNKYTYSVSKLYLIISASFIFALLMDTMRLGVWIYNEIMENIYFIYIYIYFPWYRQLVLINNLRSQTLIMNDLSSLIAVVQE